MDAYEIQSIGNRNDNDATRKATLNLTLAQHAIAAGENVILFGNPGTGKTHLAMTYALQGRDAHRVQCHEEMTPEEFFGDVGIENGSTKFDKGVGAITSETGGRLIADEVNRASEAGTSPLFSLADHKNVTLRKMTVIRVDAGAQVIGTMNGNPDDYWPADHGIRDRFIRIEILEPTPDALLTVDELLRETARRAVRYGVSGFRAWQHWERMLGIMRVTVADALANARDYAPETPSGMRLSLPSIDAREEIIQAAAAACFGADSKGIVHAWRIGAAKDLAAIGRSVPAPTESETDRMIREAFEQGAAQEREQHANASYVSNARCTTVQRFTSKDEVNGAKRGCVVGYNASGAMLCRFYFVAGDEWPTYIREAIEDGAAVLRTVHVPVTEYDAIMGN